MRYKMYPKHFYNAICLEDVFKTVMVTHTKKKSQLKKTKHENKSD